MTPQDGNKQSILSVVESFHAHQDQEAASENLAPAYLAVIADFIKEQVNRIEIINGLSLTVNPNTRPFIDKVADGLKITFREMISQDAAEGEYREDAYKTEDDYTPATIFIHKSFEHPDCTLITFQPSRNQGLLTQKDVADAYTASIKPLGGSVTFSWKVNAYGVDDSFEYQADDGTPAKPVLLMDPQSLKRALNTWFRDVGGLYAPRTDFDATPKREAIPA